MDKKNHRAEGSLWEEIATNYLKEQRVEIKQVNYRCRNGEIDIIGQDRDYLVFFEVKYRKTAQSGWAEEAVNYGKQRKICRVSDYYRMKEGISDNVGIRFDVIGINGGEICWYKDAFSYIPMF